MTAAEIGALTAAAWAQIQNPESKPMATAILSSGVAESRESPFDGLSSILPASASNSPAQQSPPPAQNPPPANPPAPNPLTQTRANEPSGFPGPDPKDGRLPEPQEGGPNKLRIIEAERTFREGQVTKARGRVHLQYRGYDIFAREVDFHHDTNRAELRGGAQLIGKDAVVLGETIAVDFDQKTFHAYQAAGEMRPSFLQGRTLDNVYFRGAESWGSEREIFTHNCGLTTCTYDKPHYELDSRDSDYRPGKRIILRHVKLHVLGRTVLNIPYLSIPLDNRREGYTPEVGHTTDQGYYIKTRWDIPTRGPIDLVGYLDYFEKLGFGLGGRLRYYSNRSEGYVRLYGLTGSTDSVEIQTGHKQLFGPNLFQIETNRQQRNYLNAPQNTITTVKASMVFPKDRNTTRISYFSTENESATFQSKSQTWALSDSRFWTDKLRTNTDVSWVRSASSFTSGSSEREQVDVRLLGSYDVKQAQAELAYQRSIPVGETNNFFNASDRTPVLSLRTESNKLFPGKKLPVSFRSEVSVGEFVDPVRKDQITRSTFDFSFNHNDSGRKRFSLDYEGRFKQGLYSDDTAQFITGYGGIARYSLGYNVGLNLRYNYLERRGFTPLTIDRVGKTNLATMDMSFRPARSLSLGVQTGYDFLVEERGALDSAWQQVGVRMEWRPQSWFEFRALPTYDTIQRKWSNIRFDLGYLPGATYVGIGARYDGVREVWGAFNIFVDALKWGRMKASTLLTYNGYLKKFESKHYSLTYDLHCAEAILQVLENNVGFRSGRSIAFYIRLKAFPFDTPFGLNSRGAPIGTATGRGF